MKQRYSIIQSDEFVVVVSKPAGLLVIPDRYDTSSISLQELLSRQHPESMVVHRLDRDTSGVVVFANNADAHRNLSLQFQQGTVSKTYLALCEGSSDQDSFLVDLPLDTDADRSHRTKVDRRNGKPSTTRFEVEERFEKYTLVCAKPETGRTHQIRAHLKAVGLPIVADPLYGSGEPLLLSSFKRKYRGDREDERPLIARTALHAAAISFQHPGTGMTVEITQELPRDMKAAINQLRKHGSVYSQRSGEILNGEKSRGQL